MESPQAPSAVFGDSAPQDDPITPSSDQLQYRDAADSPISPTMSDDQDPKSENKKATKSPVSDETRTPSAFRRDLDAESDLEQEEAPDIDIPSPRWYQGQSPAVRSALGLRGQLYGLSIPGGPSPTGSTLALPYGTSRNNSVETFTTVNSDDVKQTGYDSDQSMLEDPR